MRTVVSRPQLVVIWMIIFCACAAADLATAVDDFSRLKLSRAGAGTLVPPFELPTIDGNTIEFSKLRGKVIVLNFWATWCGPCKEEMPALDRLSRRFDSDDVVVLTITTEHERMAIQQFMKQFNSKLPVLLDEQRDLTLAFMVRGLPTTIFIAKTGEVVGRAVGPRDWDSADVVGFIQRLQQ